MNMPVYAEQEFTLEQFTSKRISDAKFYACNFSQTDLTETQFLLSIAYVQFLMMLMWLW